MVILILSTVYIKAHYAVDVIGGLIIAPFILYLSEFLYGISWWEKFEKFTKINSTYDKP